MGTKLTPREFFEMRKVRPHWPNEPGIEIYVDDYKLLLVDLDKKRFVVSGDYTMHEDYHEILCTEDDNWIISIPVDKCQEVELKTSKEVQDETIAMLHRILDMKNIQLQEYYKKFGK